MVSGTPNTSSPNPGTLNHRISDTNTFNPEAPKMLI